MLIALLAFAGAGCGFRPLYGAPDDGGVAARLSQISVAPIAERRGQLLRIELENRLYAGDQAGAKHYRLEVTTTESKTSLAVRRDATATRANLTVVASYRLFPDGEHEPLLSGSARSVNSYNILDSEFATLAAETDATRRAARDLAAEITARLAIFLRGSGA